MQMYEIELSGPTPVDSYGPGFFRIAGQLHEGGLLLLPDRVASWAGFDDLETILAEKAGFDILLVGTGADMQMLPPETRKSLEEAGFGVEPMPTPAACRTYNVLLSEGRRIAAALIPV